MMYYVIDYHYMLNYCFFVLSVVFVIADFVWEETFSVYTFYCSMGGRDGSLVQNR